MVSALAGEMHHGRLRMKEFAHDFPNNATVASVNSILAVAVAVLALGIVIVQGMLNGTMQYVAVGLAVVAVLICVAQIGRNARDAK